MFPSNAILQGDIVAKVIHGTPDILQQINGMAIDKATGLDKISAKFIKASKEHIILPLQYVINLSLKTRCVPESWKSARVVPIYKAGDKSSVHN